MSRSVPARPATRGSAIVIASDQSKASSPNENLLYGESSAPKLAPLSAATSPEQLYPLNSSGFNTSLETTPSNDSQWDSNLAATSSQKQDKARRKLNLDPSPAGTAKVKKAKVSTPVSRAKAAAGGSPGEREEMDPSTISLSDSDGRRVRASGERRAMNGRYTMNDELGPDPMEGSEWRSLFEADDAYAAHHSPMRIKRIKKEVYSPLRVKQEIDDEEEELMEAAAAAADEGRSVAAAARPKTSRPPKETAKGKKGSPTGGRIENSLLVLTKKFMDLRNRSEELNLNEAASTLGVQKRRLYDITNVLEGIDLVTKVGKNSIRWTNKKGAASEGMAMNSDQWARKMQLEEELNGMAAEERRLDDLIRDITNAFHLIKEDPTDKPYSYVKLDHLRKVIEEVAPDKLLIAVKARSDEAVIEVADPVETHSFAMMMRCADGLESIALNEWKEKEQEEGEGGDAGGEGGEGSSSSIVLPPSTSGLSSAMMRQPCDDLITPSKMVDDNSCLSEYLSPLKFLVDGVPPMSLLTAPDGPYLSIVSPGGMGSSSQPGPSHSGSSSHPSTSSTSQYYQYLDANGPTIADIYSQDDWF